MIAYAQTAEEVAKGFVGKFNDIILFPLIALMSAVALLVFLYGVFEYVRDATDASARLKGQQHMLWGVVGLVVMLSAYSILIFVANTIGEEATLEQSTTVTR